MANKTALRSFVSQPNLQAQRSFYGKKLQSNLK